MGPVYSQQKSSVKSANSETGTYNCYTIRVKYTNVSMIATVSPRHLIDAHTGNQTGAVVVTLQCDECGLITNRAAWTEDQNRGDDEMEGIDGGSDSKKSKQNLKVCAPNFKVSVLHLGVVSRSVVLGQFYNPNTTPKDKE